VRVCLRDGTDASLPIRLYGESVRVTAGGSVERAVPALKPLLPQPEQPPGYAPERATPAGRTAAGAPQS
jgi:alpha,alpha-trehalose phosphorylase